MIWLLAREGLGFCCCAEEYQYRANEESQPPPESQPVGSSDYLEAKNKNQREAEAGGQAAPGGCLRLPAVDHPFPGRSFSDIPSRQAPHRAESDSTSSC